MKHKSSKRSVSNKHPHHRPYQTQSRRLSTSNDNPRNISPIKVDLGTGTVHLDAHTLCLKPNVPLKSQKILKRDLLRCSNQRPSLLGPQTLQPPRIHHGSRQVHSIASSSSTSSSFDRQHSQRHRSLSVHSRTFHATVDRIAPWPDISINCLRSDGNDLLRPLKNLRHNKNPRIFSPKYYASLNEITSIFQFHLSTRTYIDEYRKQKGYLLNTRLLPQRITPSVSSSVQLQQSDDDQFSAVGGAGSEISTARDRTEFSLTNISLLQTENKKFENHLFDNSSKSPRILSITDQINILPSIPNRNNHLRPSRLTQHPQTITLPALNSSSLQYLDSMNSVDKVYRDNKKSPTQNQSKLYFLDGRQKKRILQRPISESEVTSSSQDNTGLRATGSSITTTDESPPPAVVIYQLPRRTQFLTAQNDIELLS